MRRFILLFASLGIPFGLAMAIAEASMFSWQTAMSLGLSNGVLFGLGAAIFFTLQGARMRKRFAGRLTLLAGEQLLKEGPANHFASREGVGGWLYLTNQRLYFKSHRMNVQVHELSLPLEQIADAQAVMTARIVPNGLQVTTTSGASEHFVVEGREE